MIHLLLLFSLSSATWTADGVSGGVFTVSIPIDSAAVLAPTGEVVFDGSHLGAAPLEYLVGVPQTGEVRVTVLEKNGRVLRANGVRCLDLTALPEGEGVLPQPSLPATASGFYPETYYDVSAPFVFRDLRVVRIRLYPVRYHSATREVHCLTGARFAVSFADRPTQRGTRSATFERIMARLVVNYEQCRDWRCAASSPRDDMLPDGPWFKLEVAHSGLCGIGRDELLRAGIDPRQFDPRTLRVFAVPFDLLPRDVTLPYADSLLEIPCYVIGENDGSFDDGDGLYFYGSGASHYVSDSTLSWYENGYAVNNVYWLTFGGLAGKRMTTVDAHWDGSAPDTTITAIAHIEEDHTNPTRSGTNWYWKDVSPGEGLEATTTVPIALPEANGSISFTLGVFTFLSTPTRFTMSLNGTPFATCDTTLDTCTRLPPRYLIGATSFTGDSASLMLVLSRLTPDTRRYTFFLNSIDVQYQRNCYLDRQFISFQPARPTPLSVRCRHAGENAVILDISDPHAPLRYTGFTSQGSDNTLTIPAGPTRAFCFARTDNAVRITPSRAAPFRLRQADAGCDYLIITHPRFYSTLQTLVDYRRNQYRVRVVTIDEIFDSFSSGKYDPLAIKHFLYYTTGHWTQVPVYVLMVGDGTYDYRNNLGLAEPPNFVPLYHLGTELSGNAGIPPNHIYEGEYVNFTGIEAMVMGRIAVRTNAEVRDFVAKLVDYETGDIDGIWNKRILLTSDDEYATTWEGTTHLATCEGVAPLIPDSLYDVDKIYMVSYWPKIWDKEEVDAQADLIQALSRGCYAGLFIGHGNHWQLAHEGLLYDTELPRIDNEDRLFFFYFGSCTVGRFDDSDHECLAEGLVRRKDGAIGTMGATSGTSGIGNEAIARTLFTYLTDPDTSLTLGECVYLSKRFGSSLYLLMGDPATQLRRPTIRAATVVTQDSVRPLDKLTAVSDQVPYYVTVHVRDTTAINRIDTIINANRISSHVRHAVRRGNLPQDTVVVDYRIRGKEVYRSYWTQDTCRFIVPRIDTAHIPLLRISTYKDGQAGSHDSTRVYGAAALNPDETGPTVQLYCGGRPLRDSAWVESKFTLTGAIEDPNGVNLLNSKEDARGFYLQRGNSVAGRIDLRDYFMYDENSCTSGQFRVGVSLDKELETLMVSVSDNDYNQSLTRVVVRAEQYDRVEIENALVYPNPVRTSGPVWFTFTASNDCEVTIKVFTIAGRLIRAIERMPATAGFNHLLWDGRDAYGDLPANGLYLVKFSAAGPGTTDVVVEKFIIARDKQP